MRQACALPHARVKKATRQRDGNARAGQPCEQLPSAAQLRVCTDTTTGPAGSLCNLAYRIRIATSRILQLMRLPHLAPVHARATSSS